MIDQQGAAYDLPRLGGIASIKYARVAAVLIDCDSIRLVLEDQTCAGLRGTADERCNAAAPIGLRQRRALIHIAPCRTILQPHIERTLTVGKPLEIRCGICKSHIDPTLLILRMDIAVQLNRTATGCIILDVDADAPRMTAVKCRRIGSGGIHLRTKSVQRHRIVRVGVDAAAGFRAADFHLRHAGDVQRALIPLDAVSFLQGSRRIIIVYKQAQRTGFDIYRLRGREPDAGSFGDTRTLSAGLDCQDMIRGIDLEV